jgi:hypothetical protein
MLVQAYSTCSLGAMLPVQIFKMGIKSLTLSLTKLEKNAEITLETYETLSMETDITLLIDSVKWAEVAKQQPSL